MEVHGGTGTGGYDDGEVAGEDFRTMFCDFARGGPIAGVEGGLAAASLVFGVFDGDAKVFEDFDGGLGSVIIEGITKAGAHQKHAFVGGALEVGGHEKFGGFVPHVTLVQRLVAQEKRTTGNIGR